MIGRCHPGARRRSHPETGAPTRRMLLTVCVMMATIMQALDTTIANVALPYMQGSLGTTQDQVNWVLTSYIVAAAIMTLAARLDGGALRAQAPVHRLHRRFHRRLDAVRHRAVHRADGRCSGCCRACSARRWCRCRRPSCSTSIPPSSAARPWRSGAWASCSARSWGRRSAAG